jgi:hypothetical protein
MLRLFVGWLPCVAFCLATLSLASARAEEKENKRIEGPFVHVALYTFKADAPTGTAEEFAAEAEKVFAQIDSVRSFRIGKPAAKATPREFMVDPKSAYHLGIVLTFDNFEGMAKYGNDRRHNELKKKYAKHFEKIVAYDIEDAAQDKKEVTAEAAGKVSGIVTLNGGAVSSGVFRLHQKDGHVARAEIKDGAFAINSLPAGWYVVSIEGPEVPAKYRGAETSGLTTIVKAGDNDLNFELRSVGSPAPQN